MRFKLLLVAAGFAVSTQSALSRNLVWNFEGIFASVPAEYQALGVSIGDKLSGTIQVNTNARDALPETPIAGQYDLNKLTVCVPALGTCVTFSGPHTAHVMTVINDSPPGDDPPFDSLEIYGRDVPLDSTADPTKLFFFNGQLPTSTFASDGIPLTPPPVSAFQFIILNYVDTSIAPGAITGTITAISSR